MKVPQYRYLSAEAQRLRARDGTPPWAPHICELDDLAGVKPDSTAFAVALAEARRMRAELEADDD
jgi:hypothetical protein